MTGLAARGKGRGDPTTIEFDNRSDVNPKL